MLTVSRRLSSFGFIRMSNSSLSSVSSSSAREGAEVAGAAGAGVEDDEPLAGGVLTSFHWRMRLWLRSAESRLMSATDSLPNWMT